MVGDDDNERAVARALEQFGRLDTFIGNAGMFDYGAGLVDTPIDALDRAFDELFALNVKACLLGAKAAVPALMEVACDGGLDVRGLGGPQA
jgi:NAD(P)-dependent dehydrogenase (short-subunit alcohol dehydrogenase family)